MGYVGAYSGVDFSLEAVRQARGRIGDKYITRSDLRCLDYLPKAGVVVALELLEHMEDDMRPFRIIGCGTRFIFSVPSFGDPGHLRFFKTCDAVAERYGSVLKNLSVDKIGLWFIGDGTLVQHN